MHMTTNAPEMGRGVGRAPVQPPPARSAWRRYVMPLLTVGLATLAHWLLQEYTQQTVLIFYFGAVIFTAWYGGLIPGLLTTVLSVLAADYFVLEPVYRFGISNVTELIALALFGSFAAMASGLSGQLRAARAAADLRALQAATLARQLEEQAGELEQQNIELEQQAAELEQQYEEAQGLSARLEQAFAAEQAARREADGANKAKFDFLTRMSHELRTPLNALAGYAQLLDMGVHGPLNNQQREQVQRMQRNQEHLLNLINDVLNFAKLEAGHVQFNVKVFPVAEVLSSLEPLIAPQMLQNGLCYVCEAPSDDVQALADRDRVQQIVLNLLSNAVKHTKAGGRVAVSCTAHQELLAIRVNDTGEGIPADHLEAIFDPFVQLAGDSARTRGGVGLGLAISRDLARAMDGDLVAESAPGLGSTFTLWLRRAVLTPH